MKVSLVYTALNTTPLKAAKFKDKRKENYLGTQKKEIGN